MIGPPFHVGLVVRDLGGAMEQLGAVPGTLWGDAGSVALHHISFWSPDLEGDSHSLVAGGHPLVATTWRDGGPGVPSLFAYHRRDDGPYLELLDERERSCYEAWWAEPSEAHLPASCPTS